MAKNSNIETKTENFFIYGGTSLILGLFAVGGFIWAAVKKHKDTVNGATKLLKNDNLYFYTFLVGMIILIGLGITFLTIGFIRHRKNK